MRILYAEDERELSMAVAEILKMEGYEVDVADDGQKAWERLKTDYYDAAILDIMMPGMDGMEVLTCMRQNENYTPVLMLTAKTTTDDKIEGLSSGADDYLGKPFTMKELLARLQSLLRRNTRYKYATLKCGNMTLNGQTCELRSDKCSLRLSSQEAELLSLLMRTRAGLTLDRITEIVWHQESDKDTARLYLSYIKNKLKQVQADVGIVQDNEVYRLEK